MQAKQSGPTHSTHMQQLPLYALTVGGPGTKLE
jgi:hypothetical protein